jgi:hypothetical protein
MDELVCHCFGYTAKDIEQDLAEHGWSSILERILVAKRLGGCRCAELNPRGV